MHIIFKQQKIKDNENILEEARGGNKKKTLPTEEQRQTWVNLQVIMLSEGNKTAPLHQKQYSDFIFIKF